MTIVANKHVARVGHEFAAAMTADTPIIEIAKMVSHLATALDEQTALVGKLTAENSARGDIIERLIGQYSAAGFHAMQNSLNPGQSLLFDALQVMKQDVTAFVVNPTHSVAITDIINERQRQQSVEGWTPEHDDEHRTGELARAAVCYASHAGNPHNKNMVDYQKTFSPARWPWSQDWWKPTNPRRDLVKAGALIAAEIERLDRAAGAEVQS
ncbi:MAG: hypothetical protein E7H83_26000 [Enterobacteriaceae bacterium]|nr:hypothetical protein [Enterobacteriaceae bacterium]PTA96356.1 hypothetical protein C9415_05855 [Kluyvera sp. Nf5]